jgi:DNA repair photolyase
VQYIERKTLLYKTGVEYGDYTINNVQGCSHGCTYPCYAFMMAKRFGVVKNYEEWTNPKLVSNAMELLDKELPKLKDKIESVHLCFTTDPFMCGKSDVAASSIDIITKLNSSGIKCTVLTKGVLPVQLADLSPENEYGITLISLNEDFRKKIEPHSAPFIDRIESMKRLHEKGCKTWASIEPYPTPNIIEQDINDILFELSFVDRIIFGRMNYNAMVGKYVGSKKYYNELSKVVIDFCVKRNIEYHIKEGTMTTGTLVALGN